MEDEVKCRICDRTFKNMGGLDMHNAAKHSSTVEHKISSINIKKVRNWLIVIITLGLLIAGIYALFPKQNSVSGRQIDTIALVGSKAPDFRLPSTTGNEVSLSDYYGKNSVLLYFQEGVMCDPCWQQTLDIQKEYDKFQAMNIELLTITVDPLNALIKNAKRFGITLPILEDEDLKVSSAYGVLEDSMHPGSRPGHTFVLVDKGGNIIWKKAYFIASGSTEMTMDMNGNPMTMDMGMDMGKPGSVMYLPVDKLLEDLKSVNLESSDGNEGIDDTMQNMNMPGSDMSMQDHTMCLTPIHTHIDFKMYVSGTPLNFSQRQYMDQDNKIHFHPTVKVAPEDIPNMPFGELIHIHKENATIREFLKILDLPFDVDNMQGLKVYANGDLESSGLDYILEDKDRVLVTDSTDGTRVKQQITLVTDYAIQGKEKNPSLFGGC